MTVTGNIPKKIIFVCSTWVNEDAEDEGLVEVYPVASDNKKRLESARSWAKGSYYHRQQKRTDKIEEIEFDNEKGFKDIRIRNLEVRGEGGRAYKIVVEDKYLTDMREDELMEVILTKGIREGGILNGTFVFGTVGAQNKVMLKDGELYNELMEYLKAKSLKKIPAKELEFATLYESASGSKEVYLGKCKLVNFVFEENRRSLFSASKAKLDIKEGNHLWATYYESDKWEEGYKDNYLGSSFKKSHSMVKKIKTFESVSIKSIRKGLFEGLLKEFEERGYSISVSDIPFEKDEEIVFPEEIIRKLKSRNKSIDFSEIEEKVKKENIVKISKFEAISK